MSLLKLLFDTTKLTFFQLALPTVTFHVFLFLWKVVERKKVEWTQRLFRFLPILHFLENENGEWHHRRWEQLRALELKERKVYKYLLLSSILFYGTTSAASSWRRPGFFIFDLIELSSRYSFLLFQILSTKKSLKRSLLLTEGFYSTSEFVAPWDY